MKYLLGQFISILTKRCRAAVVFGVMHRNRRQRYEFIATSYREMMQHYGRISDTPLGALTLNLMEHYIYKYPEGWYQWKKYQTLDRFAPSDIKVKASGTMPLLEPSFG